MPPPKPAEPPLQRSERPLPEFFPAARILRSAALPAALLLDGIRDHVAHRFHPFLSRTAANISLSLSTLARDYSATLRTDTWNDT